VTGILLPFQKLLKFNYKHHQNLYEDLVGIRT